MYKELDETVQSLMAKNKSKWVNLEEAIRLHPDTTINTVHQYAYLNRDSRLVQIINNKTAIDIGILLEYQNTVATMKQEVIDYLYNDYELGKSYSSIIRALPENTFSHHSMIGYMSTTIHTIPIRQPSLVRTSVSKRLLLLYKYYKGIHNATN